MFLGGKQLIISVKSDRTICSSSVHLLLFKFINNLSLHPSAHQSMQGSINLLIHQSICLFNNPSIIHLSIQLPIIPPSVYPSSIHPFRSNSSIHLYVYPLIYQSILLPFCYHVFLSIPPSLHPCCPVLISSSSKLR